MVRRMEIWRAGGKQMRIMWCFILFCCGACGGSLVHCAVTRRLAHEKIWKGRSRCAACGRKLSAADLIPLAGFLLLRGRCRYCRAAIGWDCFVAEAAGGTVFAAAGAVYGMTAETVYCCAVCLVFLAIGVHDFRTMIIPDRYQLLLLLCHGMYMIVSQERPADMVREILRSAVFFITAWMAADLAGHVFHRRLIGGGDLKLLSVCMLLLGPYGLAMQCALASLSAMAAAVMTGRRRIPFGPFLVAAAAVLMLVDVRLFLLKLLFL